MKRIIHDAITLGGRKVRYRLRRSSAARKLHIRVGPQGVEVVQPHGRSRKEVTAFLRKSAPWITGQIQRVERLRLIRQQRQEDKGTIPYRGQPIPIRVEAVEGRGGPNRVFRDDGAIVIRRPQKSRTPPARSLENWLRKEARATVKAQIDLVRRKLKCSPGRLYIMGQRTKWGNCSRLGNLSFNWRLIMAPDFVLRYIVTHELVHLVVPDHSQRFWLTVQSFCPQMERAKQWLCADSHRMMVDLAALAAYGGRNGTSTRRSPQG